MKKRFASLLLAVLVVLANVENAIAQMAMRGGAGGAPLDRAGARDGGDDDSRSSRSELRELQRRVRETKAEGKQLQNDLDEKRRLKRQLEAQRSPKPGQSACDMCANIAVEACNGAGRTASTPISSACRDGSCDVAVSPNDTVCFRVYKNRACRDILSANQRSRVEECWMVQREKELEQVNADVERLTGDLAENRRSIDRLKEQLAEVEEDCPECATARSQNGNDAFTAQLANMNMMGNGGMQQSQGPSTFEKIMMGVGVGGSLLLGGFNSYLQYRSAANYASSYSEYVKNAAQLGIPFYAPSPYGSMMSSGSMGLSSLYGGFSGGLGALGGGGLGMGMSGYGMSSMMGMGMPGYGMSSMTGMGIPSYGMSSMGGTGAVGSLGLSGGIGIGMNGLFPGGGIFPGANGGIVTGPWTGYPYSSATSSTPSSIFSGQTGSFWGSPFSNGSYGTSIYGGLSSGINPYAALTGYGMLGSYPGMSGYGYGSSAGYGYPMSSSYYPSAYTTASGSNSSNYYSQAMALTQAQTNDLQSRYSQLYYQLLGSGLYGYGSASTGLSSSINSSSRF